MTEKGIKARQQAWSIVDERTKIILSNLEPKNAKLLNSILASLFKELDQISD